jgi:hypothetical protein
MQFRNYKTVDMRSFSLDQPKYDSKKETFISKFNNQARIKTDSIRLLNIEDGTLQVEMLYSSNDFYNYVGDFDCHTKSEIVKNGPEWLGGSLNEITINNMFKKTMQLPEKLPMFPTMNFEYNDIKVMGKRRKKLSVNDLKPNMEIEVGFTIDGVYFYKDKCYVCYIAQQIQVINENSPSICKIFGMKDETTETNAIEEVIGTASGGLVPLGAYTCA